ncbi:1-deoxy-D-xylulose-5-phosphate reductoisomerase [Serratia ureilytica]
MAGRNVAVGAQCWNSGPPSPRWRMKAPRARAARHSGGKTASLPRYWPGEQAACELAALDDVDQVTAAIVGAGLLPTLAAIRAGEAGAAGQQKVARHLRPSVYGCGAAKRVRSCCRSTASTTRFSEFA